MGFPFPVTERELENRVCEEKECKWREIERVRGVRVSEKVKGRGRKSGRQGRGECRW